MSEFSPGLQLVGPSQLLSSGAATPGREGRFFALKTPDPYMKTLCFSGAGGFDRVSALC